MAKHSKRYRQAAAKIDRARRYPLDEAIQVLVTTEGVTKFDETVELAVKLGVDPRQADQNVRGTVVLPHGRGKAPRARRPRRRARRVPITSERRSSPRKFRTSSGSSSTPPSPPRT